jgi:hypothetical protein
VTHGDSGSASQEPATHDRARIAQICKDYLPKDIFNMDKTALFYKQTAQKRLAFSRMDGIKQDEKRITLAMCCNSDGMEKLPSLCIGQSAKARCFAGHSLSSKGFFYGNNKTAWMSGEIFAT